MCVCAWSISVYEHRKPFLLMNRYLDPASSLGEIMFGLIMTLTFTLGAEHHHRR